MRASLAVFVVTLAAAAFLACSPREEVATAQPTQVAPVEPGQAVPWAAIPAPLTPVELPPDFLASAIEAPADVNAGEVLRYQLILTNSGEAPYQPRECPAYVAWLQSQSQDSINVAGESLTLNCRPAGALQRDSQVRFEMELLVPAQVPSGRWLLKWSFTGPVGPIGPVAEAPVEIRNR